jgi:hypothetical protein
MNTKPVHKSTRLIVSRPAEISRGERSGGNQGNFHLPLSGSIMITMLERRAHPRRKVVLPVKISLSDAAQVLGYAIDITRRGAKISGLRQALEVGSTIKLARGSNRAEFRVVWVQQLDAKQIQVGVEALNAADNFWGVDLKQEDGKNAKEMDAVLEFLKGSKAGKHGSHC